MKDDFWRTLVGFVPLFVCLGIFVFGTFQGVGNAYSNCIKYHEALSEVQANTLCDKIVKGMK